MDKPKNIQIIYQKENTDLLNYRLKNFDVFDLTLIIYSDKKIEELVLENKKIMLLKIDSENYKEIFDSLTSKLLQICKNFEDVIFYSEENEFVNLKDIDQIKEKLTFDPFFLLHKSFYYGRNFMLEKPRIGTFVFLFSHILQHKDLLFNFVKNKENKKNFSNFSDLGITNGWSFNYFYNVPKQLSIYKNNLLPVNDEKFRIIPYIENTNSPHNLCELPSYEFNNPQKILILLAENISYDRKKYTKIANVKFEYHGIDVLSETNDFVSYKFVFLLPKKILYGDKNYDEFIKDYKKNEISKVINCLKLSDEDIIEIKNPS
jgi:hypothetical protein